MIKPLLVYGFDGIIGSAGGYVQCGNEVLYDQPMSSELCTALVDVLRKNEVYCTLEAKDAAYADDSMGKFFLADGKANSEYERWQKAIFEGLGIKGAEDYRGEPVYKIVFICRSRENLAEARTRFEKDFRFVCEEIFGGMCSGELINRDFDKGRAVLRVCEYYGVDAEDTIGFGDSMNDLEMMETTGISVCMENGSDELKAHSDMICPAVDRDGLAAAFRELDLC